MALEYFGQVYGEGGDATARARAYVDRFLASIDQRYAEVFWLLWTSFRNGIIHGSWPQGLCIRGNPGDWLAVGANNALDGDHPRAGVQL